MEPFLPKIEIVALDNLVPTTHPYRRVHAFLPEATEILADVSRLKGLMALGLSGCFVACLSNSWKISRIGNRYGIWK